MNERKTTKLHAQSDNLEPTGRSSVSSHLSCRRDDQLGKCDQRASTGSARPTLHTSTPEAQAEAHERHRCRCTQKRPKEAYPEGDLQILAAPDIHFLVVSANFEEVLAVSSEQPTCHCWRSARGNRRCHRCEFIRKSSKNVPDVISGGILSSLNFTFGHWPHAVVKRPPKRSDPWNRDIREVAQLFVSG